MLQAIGNTHSGGVNDGLARVLYQVFTDKEVAALDDIPTKRQRDMEKI
jgi:hypothetical protein